VKLHTLAIMALLATEATCSFVSPSNGESITSLTSTYSIPTKASVAAGGPKKNFSPFGYKPVDSKPFSQGGSYLSNVNAPAAPAYSTPSYSSTPAYSAPVAPTESAYSTPAYSSPASSMSGASYTPGMPTKASVAASGLKKSYSPFGSNPVAAQQMGSSYLSGFSGAVPAAVAAPVYSASANTGASYTPGMPTKASVAASGLKKSYSPFGTKPVASQQMGSSYLNFGAAPVAPAAPASSGTIYTPGMPTKASVAASGLKKSYSPFGRKPVASQQMGSSYLDFSAAPVAPAAPAASTSYYTPGMPTKASVAASGMKKSYSPFGSKPVAAQQMGSSYLSGVGNAAPFTPSYSAPAYSAPAYSAPSGSTYTPGMPTKESVGRKKNYSPFGSKPVAAQSVSSQSGNYLDQMSR